MQRLLGSCLLALAVGCGGSSKPDSQKPEAGDDRLERGEVPDSHRARGPGDDDDDDELQIKGLRGRLEKFDIEAGVKPHQSAISSCFFENTKKKKYVSGAVKLEYRVKKDGTVEAVRISESELGAWPVEKCLLSVARKMRFAKPKGGATAEFSLPLSFPKQTGRTIQWWEEEQTSKDVDAKRMKELASCSTEARVEDPRNVWVILYVGTRGQVWSAGFASKGKKSFDDAWADCAASKVMAWQLTDPRGSVAKAGFRYNPE